MARRDDQLINNHLKVLGAHARRNITTLATTLLKTGPGALHTVTVNTKGATANTCKVYDGIDATGTLLATIDTTSGVVTLHYDCAFIVGLCVVTATGTAADLTVTWS